VRLNRQFLLAGALISLVSAPVLPIAIRSAEASDTVFSGIKNLSNNIGVSDFPQLSISDENVFAVWKDTSFGNGDILFSRSHDSGENFENTNLSNNIGVSNSPQVASADDRVYVVWSDNVPGNDDIFIRASSDAGQNFGTATNLSSNPGASTFPAYEDHASGVNSNGQISASDDSIYVVWQDTTTGNSEILFRRSSDGGSTFENTINLSSNSAPSLHPILLVEGNHVFVVWEDKSTGGGDVFYRRSEDGGASFGGTINLSETSAGSYRPKLANHGDHLYVIWLDKSLGKTNVHFKKSSDDGISFSGSIALTNADTSAGHHQITATSNGMVFVIWRDGPNPIKELYLRASEDHGNTFGDTPNLSNNDVDSAWGQVAADDDGVYVVWRDTPPGSKEVYFRESHDGSSSFQATVDISNNAGTSGIPLQDLSGDKLYVVWRDSAVGNYEIFLKVGTVGGGSLPVTTTVFPPGGTYSSPQSVTLTTNVPASTYYTLDGSPPTTSSSLYTEPVDIETTTTLKFFSIDGSDSEPVQSHSYVIIDDTSPTVAITSPAGGSTITGRQPGVAANIVGTASDDSSGVQKVEIKVTDPVTLALVEAYEVATPTTPGDWSDWTHTLTFNTEGSYRITARATDNSGNQSWNSKIITIAFT